MTDAPETGTPLQRTPLYEAHKRLGGKLINFGGWALPVNYGGGILAEHAATRQAVGVFDVSHMGEFHFRGPNALAAVQNLATNNVARLADGQALYTVACNERGGIVDDFIVYRVSAEHYLAVVNAANIQKDWDWFKQNTGSLCTLEDASAQTALIAFQGPEALAQLAQPAVGTPEAQALKPFGFRCDLRVAGKPAWVARTGYTGEDGVEIFCDANDAPAIFETLVATAQAAGGSAVGLGARDTLRLEAKLPLYGNDLSDTITPFEAGLAWVVKLDKGAFIGSDVLRAQATTGPSRRLIGFEMKERGIPRHGYPVLATGGDAPQETIGEVTSGGVGPTVGKNIGMAYVPTAYAAAGTPLLVNCRGKVVPAEVVDGPFYRRRKAGA